MTIQIAIFQAILRDVVYILFIACLEHLACWDASCFATVSFFPHLFSVDVQ